MGSENLIGEILRVFEGTLLFSDGEYNSSEAARAVRVTLVYSKSSRMLGATKPNLHTSKGLEFITIREYSVEKNHGY